MHTGANSSCEIEKRFPLELPLQLCVLALLFAASTIAAAQGVSARRSQRRADHTAKETWSFSALADGYYVPGEEGYIDPIVTADHTWLHLEGRYNYEDLKTGSLWLGYNINLISNSVDPDKKIDLTLTPMIGAVFGRTTGVAPGAETSLTYRKLNLWASEEYVFDTRDRGGSFFYIWPQLTYTPTDWLHVGLVAQRTQALQTTTQGGFLVGVSHKKLDFTSYILDPGSKPTVILEMGVSF